MRKSINVGMDRRFSDTNVSAVQHTNSDTNIHTSAESDKVSLDFIHQSLVKQIPVGRPEPNNITSLKPMNNNDRHRVSQKLVSGAGFRAPIKDLHKCEQCEILELSLHKSKETVRSLKLQISRLEDRVSYLPPRKAESNLSEKMIGDVVQENSNELLKQYNIIVNKNTEYEIEIKKLQKVITELQSSHLQIINTTEQKYQELKRCDLQL